MVDLLRHGLLLKQLPCFLVAFKTSTLRQGGAVDDVSESATHGRARKSARANNDALSLNAYRQKAVNKKA